MPVVLDNLSTFLLGKNTYMVSIFIYMISFQYLCIYIKLQLFLGLEISMRQMINALFTFFTAKFSAKIASVENGVR